MQHFHTIYHIIDQYAEAVTFFFQVRNKFHWQIFLRTAKVIFLYLPGHSKAKARKGHSEVSQNSSTSETPFIQLLRGLCAPIAIGTLCPLCPIFSGSQRSPRKHNGHKATVLTC